MRKNVSLFLLFLLLGGKILSQTIVKGYQDGRIYLKLAKSAGKPALKSNPDNIPLNVLPDFNKLWEKYGVTKLNRPFHQAWEDDELASVIKLQFDKIHLVEDFIRDLNEFRTVIYAEKVPLANIDAVPNDALYSGLSHLTQINAPSAWNVFNSTSNGTSSITVAIVDNAVMWTHADLVANTYTNTGEIANNNVDDDNNGYIDDVNGYDVSDLDNNTVPTNLFMNHGTHCAGIAGATTDNTIGVASIGWNIKIIPVKCQPNSGSTVGVSNGYEGIVYAVRARAKIISCSWGNTAGSSLTEQSVINFAWNRGCIIIASAGNNNNSSPNYPGAYTNVYCVAAVDNTDGKLGISSFGNWVDISAPGGNINSTVPYTIPTSTPAYLQQSGTSMATPMVAGLAALMLSRSPNMTRANVLNCISSTAANIYTVAGNSTYISGNQLGAGRIDAFAAMNCAATFSALPPVANFYAFPLFTCPGSTVNLYDSSLYAPTSWNWVIQGGSPATSTLANPVVQWSSPGTYSISLTVSNGSGTSSVTKLAYVNVSGPLSLPFIEGFQTSQFLPANWSQRNIGNDPIFWERRTGLGAFGTSTACAMFDNFTYFVANERDEMRSPKFDMSNVANARLRFDVAYARYDATFSDTLEVRVSTNCGSTWTSIYINGGTSLATAPDATSQFTPTSTQWRTESVNITSLTAGQANVMFSFVNRGRYGQVIYVDNINIFTPTPTISISVPSAACTGNSITLTSSVTGAYGYTWTLPGSSALSTTLASPVLSYGGNGVYTVSLFGVNGTATAAATSTISVFSLPALTVNSTSICSGSQATLNAGGATTYSWNGVAGTSSLVVSPNATTIYTLQGANGGVCVSTATAGVNVTNTPTVIALSQSICAGNSVTLNVSGASSYSWNTGATTSVVVVNPASTTIYTVSGTTGSCTAIGTVTAFVNQTPTVSITAFPGTTICPATSVTITATGAGTYSWSNGATGNQIIISPTANTIISVSGSSASCSSSQSFSISTSGTFIPVSVSASQPKVCAGTSATLTASGANNYIWNSGSLGINLVVNPTVTTSYTVTGSSGSCSGSGVVTITVNPLPQALPTVTNAGCQTCTDGVLDSGISGGTPPYTYTWMPSGGNFATAANLIVGCYTVNVLDANSCAVSASACVSFAGGLTQSFSGSGSPLLFPNPAKDNIQVVYANTTFNLTIYDSIGRLVFIKNSIENNAEINTSAFAKGLYLCEIKTETKTEFIKLLLE